MLGEQHQRAANQIGGVPVVRRPCPGDLQMQGLRRRSAVQHGSHHQPQDAAADHGPPIRGPGKGPRVGAGGQCQHGDGAIDRRGVVQGLGDRAHFAGQKRTIIGCKRIGAGHIPQQRRGVLERVGVSQIDSVHAAIDRAVLGDGRNRRIHHRQIGIETSQPARFGRRRAPFLEVADVLRPIAMTSRIRRRLGADQSAADIGIERGRRDRELRGSLAGGQIKCGGFFHIDLYNQD